MREFSHCLFVSKSGKSVKFKIDVNDRFGKQTMDFLSVVGWRAALAMKYLSFEEKEWNDKTVQKFVSLHVIKTARNKFEAMQFIEQVKILGSMEVHFWANKFLMNKNSAKAWRAFYK